MTSPRPAAPRRRRRRTHREERPTQHLVPKRRPYHGFGDVLRTATGFVGRVDAIFADYWAALDSGLITEGWFEAQRQPIATKDQIFYGLIAVDGVGAVLAAEFEVAPWPSPSDPPRLAPGP